MQADGANVATNFRSEYKKAATGNSTNKSKNYCKSSGAASYYEEDDEDDMRDLNMDQIMNVTLMFIKKSIVLIKSVFPYLFVVLFF